MKASEAKLYRDAAVRELCRRSLATFAKRAWHVLEPSTELKWGWALDAICEHLEAVSNGQITRLLTTVPPGTMKSLLTGVIWPAWEWGPRGDAWIRFLGTAHKQDLAVRDNMKCRRLIQSGWYQSLWPVVLTGDQNAKTKFENEATGFREAMAFTSMTGSRGDRVNLDDPHSVDDANSPVKLASDILTFREALPSRVNNEQSAIAITMQRLNENDVAAMAKELGYVHLCIPMRFEGDRRCVTSIGWEDPRKVEGELMFPERFSERQVTELEITLGTYATAGQLQQRPAPRTGGLFDRSWFIPISAIPVDINRTVRAWDLAATAKTATNKPDWTAGVRMSRTKAGLFIIEGVNRFQGSPMTVEHAVINQATVDGGGVTVRMTQDPGQAGKAQIDTMIKKLAGYTVKIDRPTGDKATRATPFASQAEAGNVRILVTGDPSRDAWIEPYLVELTLFPAASHDDQVDASADALNELALGATYVYNIEAGG
jgi:predicted phage terminase large subunit-like protein